MTCFENSVTVYFSPLVDQVVEGIGMWAGCISLLEFYDSYFVFLNALVMDVFFFCLVLG